MSGAGRDSVPEGRWLRGNRLPPGRVPSESTQRTGAGRLGTEKLLESGSEVMASHSRDFSLAPTMLRVDLDPLSPIVRRHRHHRRRGTTQVPSRRPPLPPPPPKENLPERKVQLPHRDLFPRKFKPRAPQAYPPTRPKGLCPDPLPLSHFRPLTSGHSLAFSPPSGACGSQGLDARR